MTRHLHFPPRTAAPAAVAPLRHVPESDFLDTIGPSWAAMTEAQRAAYGPPLFLPDCGLATVRELLDLALAFPQAIHTEGVTVVADRWGASPGLVRLAQYLDGYVEHGELTANSRPLGTTAREECTTAGSEQAIASSLATLPRTAPRSLAKSVR